MRDPFPVTWSFHGDRRIGIPAVVISLDDQEERRRDLMALGVPDKWVRRFFPATDLRSAPVETVRQYAEPAEIERRVGRAVRSAEVGCSLSHRAVASWLADSQFPLALVLEDDIVPQTQDWLAQVQATATALLPHARVGASFICHLGARHDQADPRFKRRVLFGEPPPPEAPELFLHLDTVRTLWRAHAYLISRVAAERSSREEARIVTIADDWGERRRRGWIDEIFYTRPLLIGQDESRPSTIRPADHEDGYKPLLNEGSFFARLARAVAEGDLRTRVRASLRFRTARGMARIKSQFPYRLTGAGRRKTA